ncbi:DeoR/GlpR family DNA-binding transcription regulator [Rummeliibacillus sp. SL167]|uniref:DeoR/GlpR family DNA-binding transcription regulator n=1 Tax=Rummeliibacillus sp. SL167 TaxID=2579792 RepID=UPI00164709A1|nr:DeoR/GlpR family DNA-binding transcription regulator [Rummeliibacillus sp. SL167]
MKEKRHEQIVQYIQQYQNVTVRELAFQLNLTPETIRKDLKELENLKRVTRFHGGAKQYEPPAKEPKFMLKMNTNEEEKKRIAKVAASLIESGDTIYVDVGTTTVHLAQYIVGDNIKIITNSLAATQEFCRAIERKQFTGEVICVGGHVNYDQQSVAGSMTLEWMKHFYVQKSFISCGGITEQIVYDYDVDEAAISTYMVSQCDEAYLLVDSSKINKQSFSAIGPLYVFKQIICSANCPWEEWEPIWRKVGN